MKGIASLGESHRHDLFQETANKMGISNAIIEKDFWVCLILDYLFNKSPWQNSLAFKGGTSLAKAFHLINRFSEDIDIILDWRVLGYKILEPLTLRSKTKQEIFNKEANIKTEIYIEKIICPKLRKDLSLQFNPKFDIYVDGNDKQTINIVYPRIFKNSTILQIIRLEIGVLGAWLPMKKVKIEPYASKYYPNLFNQKTTNVLAVAPERSFWEKATILHHEANRPSNLKIPQRYARHYYDLYQMSLSSVKDVAFAKFALLQDVVRYKTKFYPIGWAKYDDTLRGALKLFPPDYRLNEIEADYNSMKEMLFGDIPDFRLMMDTIKKIEVEFNSQYFKSCE